MSSSSTIQSVARIFPRDVSLCTCVDVGLQVPRLQFRHSAPCRNAARSFHQSMLNPFNFWSLRLANHFHEDICAPSSHFFILAFFWIYLAFFRCQTCLTALSLIPATTLKALILSLESFYALFSISASCALGAYQVACPRYSSFSKALPPWWREGHELPPLPCPPSLARPQTIPISAEMAEVELRSMGSML